MSECIMIRLILSVIRQLLNLLAHWMGKIIIFVLILVVIFLILKHHGARV
ncbi:hypothetical protein [Lactococcus protaetiae]|nr:hypothetical protein [Lactococcus protaetiae]